MHVFLFFNKLKPGWPYQLTMVARDTGANWLYLSRSIRIIETLQGMKLEIPGDPYFETNQAITVAITFEFVRFIGTCVCLNLGDGLNHVYFAGSSSRGIPICKLCPEYRFLYGEPQGSQNRLQFPITYEKAGFYHVTVVAAHGDKV